MKGSSISRVLRTALCVAAGLLVTSCSSPSQPAGAPPAAAGQPYAALKSLTYPGDRAAVVALDAAIADAKLDRTKLAVIRGDLLAVLQAPDATLAGKQVACQRLSLVLEPMAKAGAVPAILVAMLGDSQQSNLARLALDVVPGAGVDAVYLTTLSHATGAVRLGLIQSLGTRRVAAAVPTLAPLLADSDPAIAGAAAHALGQVGTPAALAALRAAPDPAAPAIVRAELLCAASLPKAEAAAVYQQLRTNQRLPAPDRAAALKGSLTLDPAAAPALIGAVLLTGDPVSRQVALTAIIEIPAADMVAVLAGQFASFDAPTQTAVLAAFDRKGDAAAVPAALAATASEDAEVRAAAVTALGRLPGNPTVAAALAHLAMGTTQDEARLARQSLTRLNGPGVAETILAGARQGDEALRVVYVDQLGLRNMADTVPFLLALRGDASAPVRAAALGSLAIIAPASAQAAILDWTVAATDSSEQARSLRALVAVTGRNHDEAARILPITRALEHADPAVQLRLVQVLTRLGGDPAADYVAGLATGGDEALAAAANSGLQHWPDASAHDRLVTVAEKARFAPVRAGALDAVLKNLEASLARRSATQSALVIRLLAVAPDEGSRLRLALLLGRAADDAALAAAKGLQAEPALAVVAQVSALAIEANKAWPPVILASAQPTATASIATGKPGFWMAPGGVEHWLQADFKASRPLRQVTLNQRIYPGEFPQAFTVFVTDHPETPGPVLASGVGTEGKTVIRLPAGTQGRYLIIRNTQAVGSDWIVTELLLD